MNFDRSFYETLCSEEWKVIWGECLFNRRYGDPQHVVDAKFMRLWNERCDVPGGAHPLG